MVIIYEPSARGVKKRAKKYLKADKQSVGIFRNIILNLGFLFMKNKLKKRQIQLLEDYIIVKYFNDKEFIIKYNAIKEIIIDNEDIIVLNDIKPLLIPKNAFLDIYERELFIEKLNCYYEIEKIELAKQIYNDKNTQNSNDESHYKKETFIALYNLNKFNFRLYKKYTSTKPITRSIRNFVLIVLINMILASLGFYFIGTFSEKIENKIFIFLGTVTLIYIVLGYIVPRFRESSNINSEFREQTIRLKFAIDKGRIFINDKDGEHIYDVNEIKNMKLIRKGVLLTVLENSNKTRMFIMPNAFGEDNRRGKEFMSIVKNMQKIDSYKFDKDEKKKKINLAKVVCFINKILIILAILIIPSIIYISKVYFPNYYHKVQAQKIQRDRQSAMEFLTYYGQSFSNENASNNINDNINNEDNDSSINNNVVENYSQIANLFTDKCKYQTANVNAKNSILSAFNAWGYSTFTYQLESDMTQAQGYEIINKNNNAQVQISSSSWIIERLFIAQADLVSGNVELAEKELISLTPYIKQIKNIDVQKTLTGIQERIFTQYLQLTMDPSGYNESLNDISAINSEMPQSATINYIKQSLAAGEYINVGPVCVGNNDILYRIAIMNGQGNNQNTYTIALVYENGTTEAISQFTMNSNDSKLNY